MPDYRFIRVADTGDTPNGRDLVEDGGTITPISKVPSTVVRKSPINSSKPITAGMGRNIVENSISQFIISPLNSATGGLVSPAYSVGKALVTGGAIGSAIGTAAVALVVKGLEYLEKRVAKMEAKADEMNNKDNILIRSGSKSAATFYKGNISGVKEISTSRG